MEIDEKEYKLNTSFLYIFYAFLLVVFLVIHINRL